MIKIKNNIKNVFFCRLSKKKLLNYSNDLHKSQATPIQVLMLFTIKKITFLFIYSLFLSIIFFIKIFNVAIYMDQNIIKHYTDQYSSQALDWKAA